ncbi:MAG TPA: hypothetical protein VFV34_20285, partial [Blastocatellia bacterium]|nr:hypothetical protein [Blastocatellia bacterium]
EAVRIHRLEGDEYLGLERSIALPLLTCTVLTQFLNRSRQEDQYQTLIAFDEWLQTATSAG